MCVSVSSGRSISVELKKIKIVISLSLCFKHRAAPLGSLGKSCSRGTGSAIYEPRSKPPSRPSPAANYRLRVWVISGALELGAGAREPPSSAKLCPGVGARARAAVRGNAPPTAASARRWQPGASPLSCEVRAPSAQPVGGAGPRGAEPRGWGLRRVYKAGACLTSDLGLFIWGVRGRRRLAEAGGGGGGGGCRRRWLKKGGGGE